VTEKFEFIDAEYAIYLESDERYVPSVVKMCRWMEVSRSGFYEWRNAPESATAKRRGMLALYVQKSFDDSDGTYGYRRVQADLVGWGVPAGPELVRSLMRELGLEPCQPRPWRVSLTEGDGQEHDIPDLVARDFTAGAPGQKMVGDITYISTWEGWLFLIVTWNQAAWRRSALLRCDDHDEGAAEVASAGPARAGRGVVAAVGGPGQGAGHDRRLRAGAG
jgi:putative transposase